MAAALPAADWHLASSYAALHRCGRHGFAWEWLRRSPHYQAANTAQNFDSGDGAYASVFGLHRLEDCDRGVPAARPIWRADADPYVLVAQAEPACESQDAFDISRFGSLATHVAGPEGCEHWLLSDGWRQVRLDILSGTLADGPVRLKYRIYGLMRASPRLATLGRLIALARTGRLVPSLFLRERRASRWALVLRVQDALAAGASQREIAECLFDLGALARWRIDAPSYRRRVQRLVEAARIAANVDPRLWLNSEFP